MKRVLVCRNPSGKFLSFWQDHGATIPDWVDDPIEAEWRSAQTWDHKPQPTRDPMYFFAPAERQNSPSHYDYKKELLAGCTMVEFEITAREI